ncbi:hypothetical protein ACUIJP_06640 [Leuconostoc pseudomesenteroides]|uniref:hypothetical protein n=1 Tax=Leuconostoc pseudomesenteroides TaxID=33968 RepID=UPI00403D7043
MADSMVLATQQWLNYIPVRENGNTNWYTIYSLISGAAAPSPVLTAGAAGALLITAWNSLTGGDA